MARLTDSSGVLLGGLTLPPDLRPELLRPALPDAAPTVTAPPDAVPPPEYGSGEIVFALRCDFGSLPTLAYSPAPPHSDACAAPRPPGCPRLIEEPDERRYCPACGGYYCHAHAAPEAHACRTVLRAR